MHRVAPLLFALLTLAACGGSTENPGDSCDPPSDPGAFEVGTGEECFERLSENGEISLISGPQGGYHLWLAIGCADCGEEIRIAYGARDPATGQALLGTSESESMMELYGDTWHQTAGIQLAMPGLSWDPEMDPPPAKGTPLVLWAEAKDGSGEVVQTAELPVVIGGTVSWDPCDDAPEGQSCGNEI